MKIFYKSVIFASLIIFLVSGCTTAKISSETALLLLVETPVKFQANTSTATKTLSTPVSTTVSIKTVESESIVSFDLVQEYCNEETCIFSREYWLQKPIKPPDNSSVDKSYLFGTTQQGQLPVHDGVEFYNATGTPVHAVADGEVVYAGTDADILFGKWPDTYGNLIILRHEILEDEYPVFTLYAHLDEILISEGNFVQTNDVIGKVGTSGFAEGSHLHFEVRKGSINNPIVINPELFLQPDENTGLLVAQIFDQNHLPVVLSDVVLQRMHDEQNQYNRYVETYAEDVQSNSSLQENLVTGDLPAGDYRLTIVYNGKLTEKFIKIFDRKITFLTIQIQ